MIPPEDRPPQWQEPATLAEVAQRAAPLVGVIVLGFGALESIMRSLIIGARMQKASYALNWPPDLKLSHKARERLNEWIREVLPASGRQGEGDAFRERFMTIKAVRDNLAHNIEAMWIDASGSLRILTLRENKDYERQQQKWREPLQRGKTPIGPMPVPIEHSAYTDEQLAGHYDEIRALLGFVNEVHLSPGLPIPLARQVAEQERARRTQADHQASPKG